jgi:hypothetical protein
VSLQKNWPNIAGSGGLCFAKKAPKALGIEIPGLQSTKYSPGQKHLHRERVCEKNQICEADVLKQTSLIEKGSMPR